MAERKVKDLMLSLAEYATVAEGSTLAEALRALRRAQPGAETGLHRHRAVLVLDGAGRVVGKLTHWAVLRALEPKLVTARDMDSLARAGLSAEFIRSMTERMPRPPEAFEGMCRVAARVRARDAMLPVDDALDEETPLTDAIRFLVLSHAQSTLVARHGEVVGILRLTDVFDAVATQILGG